METKHTPGPWTVRLTTEKQHLSGIDYLDITCGNERVCAMDSSLPSKTVKANARLIAAAPEMLEALKELRMYADLKLKQHRLDYSEEHCMVQTAVRMIALANAAIAKAEGRE